MLEKELILIVFCISSTLVLGQYYLNDGYFKFIAGIGLPLDIKVSGGSFGWFSNMQVFYKLPDNITYYEPYKILQKRSVKNTFNRYMIYQGFERYIQRLGVTGSECIYRIICEVARRKVNRNGNGLLGEIIHILFTPDNDGHQGLEKHKMAKWHGNHDETDCGRLYGNCSLKDDSILLTF